jgi:lanosterol synthase
MTYLHSAQKPCGGWIGSWGICLTYATMFALESLALVGETYETSESSRRACEFLVNKQREDGGWGESYKVGGMQAATVCGQLIGFQSCEQAMWVEHKETQVVQTCWAAMALMYAEYPHPEPIKRAAGMVMQRQKAVGSFF